MALYIMADPHLSIGKDKPMDFFGNRWNGYVEKIKNNWIKVVKPQDTVVLPGDISWGMRLTEAAEDLAFLEALPGEKIISKGNHDFWWETTSKLGHFCNQHGFQSLHFLHNNAYLRQGYIICGSRGWYTEEKKLTLRNETDAKKIINREVGRLQMSLEYGKQLQRTANTDPIPPLLVCLHFPPYYRGYICNELIDIMQAYQVRQCYFGHIHGRYNDPPHTDYAGITFTPVAADYLNFCPLLISSQFRC